MSDKSRGVGGPRGPSGKRAKGAGRAEFKGRPVESGKGGAKPAAKKALKESFRWFKIKSYFKDLFGRKPAVAYESKAYLLTQRNPSTMGVAMDLYDLAESGQGVDVLNLENLSTDQLYRVKMNMVRLRDEGLGELYSELTRSLEPDEDAQAVLQEAIQSGEMDEESLAKLDPALKLQSPATHDLSVRQNDLFQGIESEVDKILESRLSGYDPDKAVAHRKQGASKSSDIEIIREAILKNIEPLKESASSGWLIASLTARDSDSRNILSALIDASDRGLTVEDLELEGQPEKQLLKLKAALVKQNELGLETMLEDLAKHDDLTINSDAFLLLKGQLDLVRGMERRVDELLAEKNPSYVPEKSPPTSRIRSFSSYYYEPFKRVLMNQVSGLKKEQEMKIERSTSFSPGFVQEILADVNSPSESERTMVQIPIPGTNETFEVTEQFYKDINRYDYNLQIEGQEPKQLTKVEGTEDPIPQFTDKDKAKLRAILEEDQTLSERDIQYVLEEIELGDYSPEQKGEMESKLRENRKLSPEDVSLVLAEKELHVQQQAEKWKQRKAFEFLEFCGYVKGGDPESNRVALERAKEISLIFHQRADLILITKAKSELSPFNHDEFTSIVPSQNATNEEGQRTLKRQRDGSYSITLTRELKGIDRLFYFKGPETGMQYSLLDPQENSLAYSMTLTLGSDGKWTMKPEDGSAEYDFRLPATQ